MFVQFFLYTLYKYWNDNTKRGVHLGEAKMAATTINVENRFSAICSRYFLFYDKAVSETRL